MDTSDNTGVPHNFTPVNPGKLSKKKKTPLFILAIALVMFLGIGVGLFLVSNPQVFQPRAEWRGGPLFQTNCSPFAGWRGTKDGGEYDCDAPVGEKNEFNARRAESNAVGAGGILRGFLTFPHASNNVCFIRHFRCQKQQGETNAQFIARMKGSGCQNTPGYRIYVNRNNPSAPYNQNFREVIESDRRDQNLLAQARFTPNWCGAQQMDIECGDVDMVFNSVIDLREQTCNPTTPPTNTPTPRITNTPTPSPTIPIGCPTPPIVNNVRVSCPVCN